MSITLLINELPNIEYFIWIAIRVGYVIVHDCFHIRLIAKLIIDVGKIKHEYNNVKFNYNEDNDLSIKEPSRSKIIEEFSLFYFGVDPNFNNHNKWKGYINNEQLLVSKNFFED